MRAKQIAANQSTVTMSGSERDHGWSSRIQAAFSVLRGAVLRRFLPNPDTVPPNSEQTVVEAFYAGRVQHEIQYRFGNQTTLIMALKHRSYVYTQDESGVNSNERLEFLGDAVLDLIVSDFLYSKFPKRREGGLTQLRSSLVNKVTLADQAKKINLGKYLLLSDGEARSGGRQRGSILSDAYESLIGAMYLDGGVEPTRAFISRTLLKDLDQYDSPHQWMNFKSVLLEYTQSDGQGQPRYRVESEKGPDHSKVFTVEVYVSDAATGRGTGTSKKDAEQNAARDAAQRLNLLEPESE